MMESESIALPLGDTPTMYSVLSTIPILAFFTGFVKKIFPKIFKKNLEAVSQRKIRKTGPYRALKWYGPSGFYGVCKFSAKKSRMAAFSWSRAVSSTG